MKNRIRRYFTYFRRGHGQYYVFVIAIWNFISIQYVAFNTVIGQFLPFYIFAIVFTILYGALATKSGKFDYEKGTYPTESVIALLNNPVGVSRFIAEYEFYKFIGAEKSMEALQPWYDKIMNHLERNNQ